MAHRISPRAEAALDDIWLYVAKQSGSIEIANRLIDIITDRFYTLATFPYIGRSREEDLGPGYRSWAVREYVRAAVLLCVRLRPNQARRIAERYEGRRHYDVEDEFLVRPPEECSCRCSMYLWFRAPVDRLYYQAVPKL